MSLRWRVALAMAALSLVATAAFGIVSYRSTRQQLYLQVDQSLLTLEQQQQQRGPGGPRDRLPDRGPWSEVELQRLDSDGEVIETTGDEPFPVDREGRKALDRPGRSELSTVRQGDDEYRVLTVGSERGGFQILRSLEETNRVLSGLRLRTALLAAAIAALAALIGWWLAGRMTAPLRRLTAATEQVAKTGDLTVTVGDAGRDEVGRLSAGFNSMIGALRRSQLDQQRLVQDAGHELRTPLTSLRTNIAMLTRYPDIGDEPRAQILADLASETDELTDLVNEVVAIASGDLDTEVVGPVDLREVADDVAARFARRTDRGITVNGETAAVISGRPKAINRALSCLVENACKFDTSGQPVEIAVSDRGLTVADRGPGLDEVDAERVFDRFYRAESSRALPGSGLGLSIVKQVADANGGTVTAAPRDGGGSIFTLTFNDAAV